MQIMYIANNEERKERKKERKMDPLFLISREEGFLPPSRGVGETNRGIRLRDGVLKYRSEKIF